MVVQLGGNSPCSAKIHPKCIQVIYQGIGRNLTRCCAEVHFTQLMKVHKSGSLVAQIKKGSDVSLLSPMFNEPRKSL